MIASAASDCSTTTTMRRDTGQMSSEKPDLHAAVVPVLEIDGPFCNVEHVEQHYTDRGRTSLPKCLTSNKRQQ